MIKVNETAPRSKPSQICPTQNCLAGVGLVFFSVRASATRNLDMAVAGKVRDSQSAVLAMHYSGDA